MTISLTNAQGCMRNCRSLHRRVIIYEVPSIWPQPKVIPPANFLDPPATQTQWTYWTPKIPKSTNPTSRSLTIPDVVDNYRILPASDPQNDKKTRCNDASRPPKPHFVPPNRYKRTPISAKVDTPSPETDAASRRFPPETPSPEVHQSTTSALPDNSAPIPALF